MLFLSVCFILFNDFINYKHWSLRCYIFLKAFWLLNINIAVDFCNFRICMLFSTACVLNNHTSWAHPFSWFEMPHSHAIKYCWPNLVDFIEKPSKYMTFVSLYTKKYLIFAPLGKSEFCFPSKINIFFITGHDTDFKNSTFLLN